MRLAISGSGALGSLFAAYLAPLSDLFLLGHWPEQMARLRAEGLVLERPDGRRVVQHISVYERASDCPTADLVLVLVKAYQTSRSAAECAQFMAEDGLALTLQNGLGNLEILAAALGEERVAQGVTTLGANVVKPGWVRHAGYGTTYLAPTAGHQDKIGYLIALLREAGLDAELVSDLESLVWGKLAVNAGINPLTAILGVPNGFLESDPQARELMCMAAEETAAVARALGVNLPYESAAGRAREVAGATAANFSSMLQDVRRGGPTEVAAITGAIVHFGQLTHTPVPLNEELLRLLQASPESSTASSPLQSAWPALQALIDRQRSSRDDRGHPD